jgi:hypothetical protein
VEFLDILHLLSSKDGIAFVCDSCELELALEQQCYHDPETVHHWCIDCCSNEFETVNPTEWDDFD